MIQAISKPTTLDLFLIGLVALIWASAFGAMKIVVPQTGPFWLATYRVSIGFLALLPFYLLLGKSETKLNAVSGREGLFVFTIAFFNMVYPFIAISWGVKSVDSGVAALLMGCSPIFALIIGHFATQDDKITRLKVLAVLLCMGGIFTIIGPSALSGATNSTLLGQLAIISGSISYVIAGTFIRRLSLPAITFTTLALGAGSLLLIMVSLIVEGPPKIVPDQRAMLALLWLGVFPTGFAYVLRYYLVRRVGMSTFSVGINLTPIFGVIIGAMLLGEEITSQILIALSLVIMALFITRLGNQTTPTNTNIKPS